MYMRLCLFNVHKLHYFRIRVSWKVFCSIIYECKLIFQLHFMVTQSQSTLKWEQE